MSALKGALVPLCGLAVLGGALTPITAKSARVVSGRAGIALKYALKEIGVRRF